ncbi:acetylserotonin O-methyltransferase-like isoform X2 [Hyla sarda]|uniref:acetylserotonin O-methyltransferase-like isoform X2 n=1 Tax=Hyla sarda TaxID=327740 RepID=UPI0024C3E928|nr:acetylserotonin O-methyltransferase-like isoform X2 [Hyla sarda]
MCSSEELEYPQKILDYTYGFLVSKTMFTACELGVFDLLHEAQEPIPAATIASRLGTSVDGMERMLDACVGLKLLKFDLKNNEGYYSNTDVSTMYLVKSSPRTLYHMMMYYSNTIYMCWHFIPQAVREGKSQYERAFGISSKEVFEAVYRSEEEMLTFMHHMDSIWNICGKDVIHAFDLSVFHTVYDLGGCSGGLAKQFVSTYKDSTVTIMDLPKVVQTAKKHFVTDKEQQIHFFEGDFFNDPIPEADLFILARIIHDWTEEKCIALLRKIYQSCRSGGGVLIVEALLNEDKSGPVISQLFSLNMLVQTEGKERTPSEYTKLLTDSGFRDIEVKATGKIYDAILGRK